MNNDRDKEDGIRDSVSLKRPLKPKDKDDYNTASLKEISLIETVTSFLEENGAAEMDPKILRHLAETLSRRIDESSLSIPIQNAMENSYSSFDVRVFDMGKDSPLMFQGRSVRELEEQMSSLRKENFNLKLRIYFMEEGQPGPRSNNAGDAMAKQLIDSKIQIEVLRNTVNEKTELLRDAACAIAQHEELQKQHDLESQAIIEQLQQQIRDVKAETQAREVRTELLEAERQDKESLVACEAKIEELAIKNADLVEQLEKLTNSNKITNEKTEIVNKICELHEAEEKIIEHKRMYEKACRIIQKLMQQLRAQKADIKKVVPESQVFNKEYSNVNFINTIIAEPKEWPMECADFCSVLTNRLEELAGFLNSLLEHKDVLGVLAADRRHAIRRAIDRSLNLSKTLNMSLSLTGTSLAERNLTQLCNFTEFFGLNGGPCEKGNECSLTVNSHEENKDASFISGSDPSIAILQAENMALKSELEKRKDRRSFPLLNDNHSESEAWSEPDRNVSLARIGLEENSSSLVGQAQVNHTESESESQGKSHGRAQLTGCRPERGRQNDRMTQLEEIVAQKDEQILNVQCQLVEADNRFKQEQLRVLEIANQLEHISLLNEALQSDLRAMKEEEKSKIIELHCSLESKKTHIEKLQQAHNSLIADAEVTEMELKAAQGKLLSLQQHLQMTVEQAEAKVMQMKAEFAQQLAEQQMENEKETKKVLIKNELALRQLKKQLDESTLQASQAVSERTRAYNEKLLLEERLVELEQQIVGLKCKLKTQQQKPCQQSQSELSSHNLQSGYTSEEVTLKGLQKPMKSVVAQLQRLSNASPDLGIESDAGRVSNVEQSNMLGNLKASGSDQRRQTAPKNGEPTTNSITSGHDCEKVEVENAELRRKLTRTKRAFEDTVQKLRLANKAKAQVEKDIKNQILKTHNVLRNVRSNMENEL